MQSDRLRADLKEAAMFMMRITHYGYIESDDHTIRLNKEARVFAPHYIGLGRYITVERNDSSRVA